MDLMPVGVVILTLYVVGSVADAGTIKHGMNLLLLFPNSCVFSSLCQLFPLNRCAPTLRLFRCSCLPLTGPPPLPLT